MEVGSPTKIGFSTGVGNSGPWDPTSCRVFL